MLKCGLEIHQRLDTAHKLFCACPPEISEDAKPVASVYRRLRPVYGELGEVDPAAAFEGGRNKLFEYQVIPESSCLIELDEEPPHELNQEALGAVLEIAMLLDARVLDEVHVMRKTVVDGSAPSAFQRTTLVAVDGALETSFGKVKIPTICVEEESSGIVERGGERVTYRIDRLGIPLVEIATDASISSGKQAREVAEKIGLLLRSTGKVQRGIGSIRQDLNVSVEGGARVEIKGAQELAQVEALVENEAGRQRKILHVKEALGKLPGQKEAQMPKDVSEVFLGTNARIAQKALSEGKSALAVRLKGLRGLLKFELMMGHRLGTELSDYAKAHAGVQGIIHGDEDMAKYGFSEKEIEGLEKALACGKHDSWALCLGEKGTAQKALEAVVHRAGSISSHGVLGETRRADGEKSRFMRPIPGSARMYPETDVPPVAISQELLEKVRKSLPESFSTKVERYLKLGLPRQLADGMARSGKWMEFERLLQDTGTEPVLVATTLLETLTALSRQGVNTEGLTQKHLEAAFNAVNGGKITKAAVAPALGRMAAGQSLEKAVEEGGLARISGTELERIVAAAGGGDVMAKVMREHRLNVDGEELRKLLERIGRQAKK